MKIHRIGRLPCALLFILLLFPPAFFSAGCSRDAACAETPPENYMADPLPSWGDTENKHLLTGFVQLISDHTSKSFIPPEERIATFDGGGTLWAEKPMYPEVMFALALLEGAAEKKSKLENKQPFKAAYEGNLQYFEKLSEGEAFKILVDVFSGMTESEYKEKIRVFLSQAVNPRYNVSYTQTVYRPMMELLNYLWSSDFKIYIVSGGGMDFMQVFSKKAYGMPPENVIGSVLMTRYKMQANGPVLIRLPQIVEPLNEGPGKPVNIQRYIGRRPIMAVGNSDGDLQMLEFAENGQHPFLSMVIHHDNGEQEYAYERGAEQILQIARSRRWMTVSMKNDWKHMFYFDNK
jgi:phosphoserine phosphatase